MKCQNCHKPTERNSDICPHCGHKKRIINPSVIAGIFLTIMLFLILFYIVPFPNDLAVYDNNISPTENQVGIDDHDAKVDLIETAQQTVYTIYANENQGSAFLYDEHGFIITNAHVVEGSLSATVKTADGNEYTGSLIGYSNEIDVALLSVPELSGTTPFALATDEKSEVGEEIIALGTPLGLENTATFGYVTGVNRTFNIPPHTFNNVYQISAPIEPGNSGGPLLSVDHEKIIAINSAKNIDEENIAYSIPLHQVVSLVDEWIQKPLNDTEITALFYDEYGNYHYDFLWSLLEHYYFEDGHYLDNENYHHYWLYDKELDLWERYKNFHSTDNLNDDDGANWVDDFESFDLEDEHWDSWNEDYFEGYESPYDLDNNQ